MPSSLSSALAKLDDSIRVLEERLHSLNAGLEVAKEQFVQNLTEARQNADAVRALAIAERPDLDWADRQSLEELIRDLEAAEAGRQQLQRKKLLDLAEELNAGTITHRLKSRVTALESLRASAVSELHAEAAKEQPRELPGPQASDWMHWACGLQGSSHATQSAELERDFPALVGFVAEMEQSYWQPGVASQGSPEDAALHAPLPTVQRQAPQLSDAAPAFAARYGHLSAARASHSENAAQASTAAAPVASPPDAHATKSPSAITSDSKSQATTEALPSSGDGPADEPERVEPRPTVFEAYSAESLDAERKGRFGLNRSVLIAVGAIVAIAILVVVISAVSGNRMGIRSAPAAATTTASDSTKTPAAPVSDIELVGQIEQRLKAIAGSSIYVTVQHGTAILEGQVPSDDALSQAEELTLQSSQIKVVRDRLQVAKAGAPHSTTPASSNAAPTE